jgi:threonyl-tRNA synthetase
MFPLWLAPVQVRLIPVSEDQLQFCENLLSEFAGVRADLDDMGDTLNKSIRRAEKEWVPFIAVVGKKEVESNSLTVRVRGTKEQQTMSPAQLRGLVTAESAGRPFRPLPLPDHLSRRPTFRG